MNTTLNGLENPKDIIAFTNTPTVLTVDFDKDTSQESYMTLSISSLNNLNSSNEYYINVNGHEINGVFDKERLSGGKFFLTTSNTTEQQQYVVYTLVNALRSIGELDVNYSIHTKTNDNGTLSPSLVMKARNKGSEYNLSVSTNIPSSVLNSTVYNSASTDKTEKVVVDVYRTTSIPKLGGNDKISGAEYITTLEKNFTKDGLSFNLSPVFAAYTENGKLSEFFLSTYVLSSNGISEQTTVSNIFATNGYLVNQGGSYIPSFTGTRLAQNVYRGENRPTENNSLIYVYYNSVTFSLFSDASTDKTEAKIKYLDGAFNTVLEETKTLFFSGSLDTFTIALNDVYRKCMYVDVVVGGITLRYNVIKPVKATAEAQRIYWYNSYGGVSFFDFTGERTERRQTRTEYYNVNLFDYYKRSEMERLKVYDKDVSVSVSLTTHNMEKDGQWQLFDLQNSHEAWTVVNGVTYKVIVNDLEITEGNVSGIYNGRITYDYSLGDTF